MDEVKRARSATLKANVDYASGEIWSGQEAKDIGLVDGISTLDEVVTTNWGLKTYDDQELNVLMDLPDDEEAIYLLCVGNVEKDAIQESGSTEQDGH